MVGEGEGRRRCVVGEGEGRQNLEEALAALSSLKKRATSALQQGLQYRRQPPAWQYRWHTPPFHSQRAADPPLLWQAP